MSKVGVVLSGCGYLDGSEIYEAVLTILALDRAGATIMALAPDVEGAAVINHYNGAEMRGEERGEGRGVLAESARIVRGKVTSLHEVSAHDLDALILVGGFGAVKNLCSYATAGVGATLNHDIHRLVEEMVAMGKPLGAMCIAPVVVALSLRGRDRADAPILTIGNDRKVATDLETWGARHQETRVDQVCIDERHRLVSTPAFMLAQSPAQAEAGINKLVECVLQMARDNARLV